MKQQPKMIRVGRRGLLSRLAVKSPQLSLTAFMSQRGVSVLNGMFYVYGWATILFNSIFGW